MAIGVLRPGTVAIATDVDTVARNEKKKKKKEIKEGEKNKNAQISPRALMRLRAREPRVCMLYIIEFPSYVERQRGRGRGCAGGVGVQGKEGGGSSHPVL